MWRAVEGINIPFPIRTVLLQNPTTCRAKRNDSLMRASR